MNRTGTDTGGTFTDFVWFDGDGRLQIHKQLSTPQDPSQAILRGLMQLHHVPSEAEIIHGSTVATNALLEGKGARTALITTAGFADVLAIGRQDRPDIYALVPQKKAPLVPKHWRFEAEERITVQGQVLVSLNLEKLRPVLEQIAADGIESIAVCLLFSFLYPDHERSIRESIREHKQLQQVYVSLSSDILPEYREYERTATTVINAYVSPLMDRYLSHLAEGLGQRRLTVMQSNGGVINALVAGREAARTVLSGPAGGVVGARFVAGLAGYDDLITFDMGGTSTDVALCPGKLPTTSRAEIGGLPLRLPVIDIHTVGAGGGSLAFVDPGGALHVGPQSAGADPGPSCYGNPANGWQMMVQGRRLTYRATTTDANLVLGRLDAGNFLGGTMTLDQEMARQAVGRLAAEMGVASIEAAAAGDIRVANANMERAIRRISVERGFDPRRFTLLAFGGAGPLHACELAQHLDIPRVLIPPVPGVLSALGMLAAAPTKEYSLTVMTLAGRDEAQLGLWLADQFGPLKSRAQQDMIGEGHKRQSLQLNYSVDMRYRGQSHELTVPYRQEGLINDFHEAHEKRFGYKRLEAEVEIVNLRVSAVAKIAPIQLPTIPQNAHDEDDVVLGSKPVWFDGQMTSATLFDRQKLPAGYTSSGPAIIFQYDTTTVVPPHWNMSVDTYGNLMLAKDLS